MVRVQRFKQCFELEWYKSSCKVVTTNVNRLSLDYAKRLGVSKGQPDFVYKTCLMKSKNLYESLYIQDIIFQVMEISKVMTI